MPDVRDDGLECTHHDCRALEPPDPRMEVELARLHRVKAGRRKVAVEQRPTQEVRYLPPGAMREYWEQFQQLEALGQVSFSLFWKMWKTEFAHMRFPRRQLACGMQRMPASQNVAEGTEPIPICTQAAGCSLPCPPCSPVQRLPSLLGVEGIVEGAIADGMDQAKDLLSTQ